MPNSESLQEVIIQAQGGDLGAFRKIVDAHQQFIFRVAYRLVQNTSDAEDIVQETFIRLWKNLHRYKPEIKLTTWLYKIVTNLSLDELKARRRNDQRNISISEDMLLFEKTGADVELLEEEFKNVLVKISAELTPKQRAVYLLRDTEQLSVEEVAVILDLSADVIKSNLYYARKKVTEGLKNYYQLAKKTGL
jgi:RNA polymerase sigma-70 factor, ECF subfamily